MKIGVLQLNPTLGEVETNGRMVLTAAEEAARMGAELCVAPELVLCGHPPSGLLLRDFFIQRCARVLRDMSAQAESLGLPPILLGAPVSNPVSQGKPVHNCAVLLKGGAVKVVGRKVLLASDEAVDDRSYFDTGVACGMLEHKGWRLGVCIGEDIRNDRTFRKGRRTYETDPVAEFMSGGADGLINLSALPFHDGAAAYQEEMLAWTAVRYRVPVVCVNQVGGQDGMIYEGRSTYTSTGGVLAARAKSFAEDILVVDLTAPVQEKVPAATEGEEALWKALVLGTRDFVHKCGFSSVLLGLSGGIDSALVAAVAVEALGSENVLGVLLPSPYTSKESITLAKELAANNGMETRTIALEPLMRSFDSALAPHFTGYAPDLTEENIQSRIRGNLLMALSNKFGSLLLNTGNKSESAVGYCTLYGDSCGALSVIGDVYKTRVYALSRWVNHYTGREIIPDGIITRAPSAELRPDQKDADSLPPYEELDPLLFDMIENVMDESELVDAGHDPSTVRQVIRLVRTAEFKRRQSPPGLVVSHRPFGPGWNLPIGRTQPVSRFD